MLLVVGGKLLGFVFSQYNMYFPERFDVSAALPGHVPVQLPAGLHVRLRPQEEVAKHHRLQKTFQLYR